jgi:hypothetical protein
MIANKFRILKPTENQTINIPIEIKWDFFGRDDSIDIYEESVLEELIASPGGFEIARFAPDVYGEFGQTALNYQFFFYNDNSSNVTASTANDWVNSYITNNSTPSGFSPTQVYYFEKPFTKSFFKLDLYDTNDSKTQTNYITFIIPVQQGSTETISLSPYKPPIKINKPNFTLDYVGDKEGFFIYWLRDTKFLNLNKFYMTAKFFDGRLGVFVKMMNEPQSSLPNKFIFDDQRYFYYKVELDYNTRTYKIFNYLNTRIGDGTPINWYEYVNP